MNSTRPAAPDRPVLPEGPKLSGPWAMPMDAFAIPAISRELGAHAEPDTTLESIPPHAPFTSIDNRDPRRRSLHQTLERANAFHKDGFALL